MYYQIKGLPPIKLVDLLKKRKTNLKDFLKNVGIVTYQTILTKCSKMGVAPPTEEEFFEALGGKLNYSSPQEGLIILDPPEKEEAISVTSEIVEEFSAQETLVTNDDVYSSKRFDPLQQSSSKKKKKYQQQVQTEDDHVTMNQDEQLP